MRTSMLTVTAIIGFLISLSAYNAALAGTVKPDATPTQPTQALAAANGLLNRGLFELAAPEYRTFIDQNPTGEETRTARYGLSVCLFRMGRHADAVVELETLSKRSDGPFAVEVGVLLGECYLTLERFESAATTLVRVVTEHGDHELADDAAIGAAESLYRLN